MEALCAQTGTSSVCGSCKPLLAELAGGQANAPEQGSRTLLWTGLATLLAAFALLFAPAIPFADSVQTGIRWDRLWRDGLMKQISGFSLLALAVLVSLISLRKRVKHISFGSFDHWRLVHVALGMLAVAALIAEGKMTAADFPDFDGYRCLSHVMGRARGAGADIAGCVTRPGQGLGTDDDTDRRTPGGAGKRSHLLPVPGNP